MGPFRRWTWCGKISFRLPSKESFCRLPQEKPVSERPAQFTFSIHHFALLFVISKKSMHINAMISQINWKPDCFYCSDIFFHGKWILSQLNCNFWKFWSGINALLFSCKMTKVTNVMHLCSQSKLCFENNMYLTKRIRFSISVAVLANFYIYITDFVP